MSTKPEPRRFVLEFFIVSEVFAGSSLEALHATITATLPKWAEDLQFARHEESRSRQVIKPGEDLFASLSKVAAPVLGVGNVAMIGSYDQITILLISSRSTKSPDSNSITLEVVGLESIEGRKPAEWAWGFTRELTRRLPTRYGHGNLADEFESKNVVREGGGIEAVGVNLGQRLPGLYWLNFFGPRYVEKFGEEKLLRAPAYATEKVDAGVALALGATPEEWRSDAYRNREQQVIEYLGRDAFFLKDTKSKT